MDFAERSIVWSIAQFTAGLCIGYVVWAAAPALVHRHEPWNASIPYYSGSLFLGGFAIGVVFPPRYRATFFGACLGQAIALLTLSSFDGMYWGGQIKYATIASLLVPLGAALGSFVRGRSQGSR